MYTYICIYKCTHAYIYIFAWLLLRASVFLRLPLVEAWRAPLGVSVSTATLRLCCTLLRCVAVCCSVSSVTL